MKLEHDCKEGANAQYSWQTLNTVGKRNNFARISSWDLLCDTLYDCLLKLISGFWNDSLLLDRGCAIWRVEALYVCILVSAVSLYNVFSAQSLADFRCVHPECYRANCPPRKYHLVPVEHPPPCGQQLLLFYGHFRPCWSLLAVR